MLVDLRESLIRPANELRRDSLSQRHELRGAAPPAPARASRSDRMSYDTSPALVGSSGMASEITPRSIRGPQEQIIGQAQPYRRFTRAVLLEQPLQGVGVLKSERERVLA